MNGSPFAVRAFVTGRVVAVPLFTNWFALSGSHPVRYCHRVGRTADSTPLLTVWFGLPVQFVLRTTPHRVPPPTHHRLPLLLVPAVCWCRLVSYTCAATLLCVYWFEPRLDGGWMVTTTGCRCGFTCTLPVVPYGCVRRGWLDVVIAVTPDVVRIPHPADTGYGSCSTSQCGFGCCLYTGMSSILPQRFPYPQRVFPVTVLCFPDWFPGMAFAGSTLFYPDIAVTYPLRPGIPFPALGCVISGTLSHCWFGWFTRCWTTFIWRTLDGSRPHSGHSIGSRDGWLTNSLVRHLRLRGFVILLHSGGWRYPGWRWFGTPSLHLDGLLVVTFARLRRLFFIFYVPRILTTLPPRHPSHGHTCTVHTPHPTTRTCLPSHHTLHRCGLVRTCRA
jgi:hypothetical protein